MRLSIILTTIGRPTLLNTFRSLEELDAEDEVIVCCDGMVPSVLDMAQSATFSARRSIVFHLPRANDWGHTLRNRYSKLASGDYLLHMDDDDCYIPGAFAKIRKECKENAGKLIFFRMRYADVVIPRSKNLKHRNVSTQTGAVPNVPKRWGTWGNHHSGDFDFYSSCDFEIAWREEIEICAVRPHEWDCPESVRRLIVVPEVRADAIVET